MKLALQAFIILVYHDSTHVYFYLGKCEIAAKILEQILQILTLIFIYIYYEFLKIDSLFRMKLYCEIEAIVFLEVFHVLLDHPCIFI